MDCSSLQLKKALGKLSVIQKWHVFLGIFFLPPIRSVLFIGESRLMTDRENGNTYSDATFGTILVVSKCFHRRQAKSLSMLHVS